MSTRFWASVALILTMVLPSVLLARGPVVAQAATNGAGPTPVNTNKAKAQEIYKAGQAAFDEGDYEKAAKLFEEAYNLDPDPILVYNEARAYESASGDKIQEAITAWKKYADLQDPRATAKVHALKRVVELQAQFPATKPVPPPPSAPPPASAPASAPTPIAHPASIPTSGTLVIQGTSNESTVKVDNVEIPPSDMLGGKPILLTVGFHAITVLDAKGVVIGKGPVRIDGGKSTTWTYFPPEEPPLLTRKQWGWVAAGTGAAALAVGGVLGVMAKNEGPEAHTASAQDSVRGKMLGANIAFGTALVAGGVGAYLLLWGDDNTPHAELAPSPTGAVLTGTF